MGAYCAQATSISTNGYRVHVQSGPGSANKCAPLFAEGQSGFIDRVIDSWLSRGDYKVESLERLKNFELGLESDRSTWYSLINEKNDFWVSVRVFDGAKKNTNASDKSYQLPMERKFPSLNVRSIFGDRVIELGLLDVTKGTDGGMEALFHHVAKNLKSDADLWSSTIVITAREANARLYRSRIGFEDVANAAGELIKTPDGMHVMSMTVSEFVGRFYGRRLYPVKSGDKDEWQESYRALKDAIAWLNRYSSETVNKVRKMQTSPIFGAHPDIDPNIDMNGPLQRWQKLVGELHEAIVKEDMVRFEYLRNQLVNDVQSYEPVHVSTTRLNVRVGGAFGGGFSYPVEIKQYQLRKNSIFGF